ncbi:right-handed parallel beta-helix repeat-containing protein [Planctomycetota bacterium]
MKCFKNSQMLVVVALSLLLCSFAKVAYTAEVTLYVSPKGNDSWAGDSIDKPFATIQKARDTISAIKKKDGLTKPITVYIRGGLYELDETLVFTLEDSGTMACPVTYTAYKDEEPVISGSRKITGPWTDYKGKIKVCTIDAVKEGKWMFRQLFLNGQRQIRARTPNDSFDKQGTFYRVAPARYSPDGGVTWIETDMPEEDLGDNAFRYRDQDIKKWTNLNDVEVVLIYSWNEARLLISELDEEKKIVKFTGPLGRRLGAHGINRYYIENVLEGLDREGEWYLDRHTGQLYYWPPYDLEDADLRAPVVNELVRFEGDVENNNYVQYINIRGLTFSDADYILPEEGIPTIRDVGDIWFPSAVTLKGVGECVFENNTIRNTGTYGLDLTGDAIRVIGNKIYDTGSGGIINRSYGKHRNVIMYNHIHHCGDIFHSAVGINIDDGGGLIANNLVHDTSHTGIYVRHFETDYGQPFQRKNQEQGLIIEYNEIHDVMQKVNDGGGIFVRDDYIVIRNNLIYNSPNHGIYLGCETRNCLVENNVVYDTRDGQQVWYDSNNNTTFNNIFVGQSVTAILYTNASGTRHEKVRFLKNIIYMSNPDAVPYASLWMKNSCDERSLPMESDYNIIYHTEGKELRITWMDKVFGKDLNTFEDWKKLGFDTHSIIADPLFVDPENHDYSLRPDSPALKMGFKPIDLSSVGLRGRKLK